jgi:Protein of unknown function (DUF1573)
MKHILKVLRVALAIGMFSGAPAMMGQDAPKVEGTPAIASSPGPRIAFSETFFDFGKVKNTGVLEHDFIVTNTGTAVLEITAVQPGCGCTMAGQWDRQVEPGKTGKIPIQFNPVSFNGPVSKTVTVTCNEPARPTHVLQLHATIARPYDVQPPYVSFSAVEGDDTVETKSVRIINNTDEDIAPETPRSPNSIFKTELKTVRPGKEFELLITYSGTVSNAPPPAIIAINLASNTPPLSVTVIASPQPAFFTGPPPILLSPGPLPAQHRAPVMTIRNNAHAPVTLSGPTVNAEGVTVQMHETMPGKAFMLNLSFPANFQTQPGQVIEVAVKTSHPKHPVITVPVFNVAATPPVPVPPPPAPARSVNAN